MDGLLLHCGSHHVTRRELVDCPTPAPWGGHFPVPHYSILRRIEDHVAGNGFEIREAAQGVMRDGAQAFGLLEVAPKGDDGAATGDYGLVVGWRNSHDKSFAASVALGRRVFVCDNLSFGGEIVIARKHTRHVLRDLPGVISRAVGRLLSLRHAEEERVARYKATQITDVQAHHAICTALRRRVITTTRVDKVLHEWHEPSHREFAVDASVWRLENAFTEALKGIHAGRLFGRKTSLRSVLDPVAGLTGMGA